MRFFLFGFFFFCLWAVFARYYYVCEIKQHCGAVTLFNTNPAPDPMPTLSLIDAGTTVLKGYDQFHFSPNSMELQLSTNNKQFLDTLFTILQQDSTRMLEIYGSYRPSERTITSNAFENLGMARAIQLENYLLSRGANEQQLMISYGAAEDERLAAPLQFTLTTRDSTMIE